MLRIIWATHAHKEDQVSLEIIENTTEVIRTLLYT